MNQMVIHQFFFFFFWPIELELLKILRTNGPVKNSGSPVTWYLDLYKVIDVGRAMF